MGYNLGTKIEELGGVDLTDKVYEVRNRLGIGGIISSGGIVFTIHNPKVYVFGDKGALKRAAALDFLWAGIDEQEIVKTIASGRTMEGLYEVIPILTASNETLVRLLKGTKLTPLDEGYPAWLFPKKSYLFYYRDRLIEPNGLDED